MAGPDVSHISPPSSDGFAHATAGVRVDPAVEARLQTVRTIIDDALNQESCRGRLGCGSGGPQSFDELLRICQTRTAELESARKGGIVLGAEISEAIKSLYGVERELCSGPMLRLARVLQRADAANLAGGVDPESSSRFESLKSRLFGSITGDTEMQSVLGSEWTNPPRVERVVSILRRRYHPDLWTDVPGRDEMEAAFKLLDPLLGWIKASPGRDRWTSHGAAGGTQNGTSRGGYTGPRDRTDGNGGPRDPGRGSHAGASGDYRRTDYTRTNDHTRQSTTQGAELFASPAHQILLSLSALRGSLREVAPQQALTLLGFKNPYASPADVAVGVRHLLDEINRRDSPLNRAAFNREALTIRVRLLGEIAKR